MNLKSRILILTTVLFLVSAVAVWFSVRTMAEMIVEQWAVRYAEKQVLYDKSRTLQPIMREIALSRQLVNSSYIKDFARQPDNPKLTELAIAEMESFRTNFRDHNYFVALLKNGKYYHNNAANEYSGKQFRYVLDVNKEEDRWFFGLIEQQRDLHININPDVSLGITKLWVDVLIRDGNEILGLAGTGIDLTDFLQNVVTEDVPGVTSLFVDHAGAIQLHRNQELIDYSSVSKKDGEHKNINLLLNRESDRTSVLAAMKRLESRDISVITEFVEINGRSQLAGIAYLPEIQWYEITLIDLQVLLPFSNFTGILWVYLATILIALILFNLVLNRLVLSPLGKLNSAMEQVKMGEDPSQSADLHGVGEIGRLMRHFDSMVRSVFDSKHELEHKVKERTAALERLTKIDPLTELFNRRGMNARIEEEISRGNRSGKSLGLLWIDIDNFKQINDGFGHSEGDAAIVAVAEAIRRIIREYDSAARWGGDEFLILLPDVERNLLKTIGQRIIHEVTEKCQIGAGDETVNLSVSIGGYLRNRDEDLEIILHKADMALYAAKEAGKSRLQMYIELAD